MAQALREEICDGFVVSCGVSHVVEGAHLAQQVNKPFWFQLVGTGITTTMALYLGAVCSHAQWPVVTCMNTYLDQLITDPIKVQGGYLQVPEAPGLGIEFNED